MLTLSHETAPAETEKSLAERLGYRPTDKLLIINGDDAGMCNAANQAVIESLEKGLLSSTSIMVPCPWFPQIATYAREHPEKDFGIHLCHTAEWMGYRWGPVALRNQVPGLCDPDGYLWHEVEQVYAHATPEEAYKEGRAQVERALAAGVDVTHLDSHMGTLQLHPEYFRVYVRLALEFRLPLRMASQATLAAKGYPTMREECRKKGIIFPDYFVYEELKQTGDDLKKFWSRILSEIKPGVTELYIHPSLPTDELKAITGSWRTRAKEFDLFTHDAQIRKLLDECKVRRIGFRPLRDLQRGGT
jgi:predicted glycoside hydrolase/deacetylase ChbG (UPF0249 family)